MNRIDRLFGMLTLLQSRKFVPAEKLAEKFNISVRSVYRDIKALNEQGIPVSFEPHRGYFIVSGYFLQPVSFSTEEANALLLMESIVTAFSDQSIQRHYSTALTKIKAVLRATQKESMEKLAANIKLQVPVCFVQNFEYLTHIQQALSSQKILEIGYSSKLEEVSVRRLEPIGLVFYAFSWHPKSMSVRQLATHIAELPSWIPLGINTEVLDFAAGDYKPIEVNDNAALLDLFETNQESALSALSGTDDAFLQNPWTMKNGDEIYLRITKQDLIRIALSQTIHHRAQLGVFLRLLNIPIPGSYGPSADDMRF